MILQQMKAKDYAKPIGVGIGAYVIAFEQRTFLNALWLALGLWALVLVLFYPLVGWGFLGLAISPMLIMASLVLHILFAVFLWGLSRWVFPVNAQDRLARA